MDINKLIKQATLEKNGSAKEAYRAIKAELLLNASSKTPKNEGNVVTTVDGTDINELDLSIIKKLVKQREDSISVYEANSRQDLANIEKNQLFYLKKFLPEKVSDSKIIELINTAYPNGYSNKDFGKIMQLVKSTYPAADGKTTATLIKKNLDDR